MYDHNQDTHPELEVRYAFLCRIVKTLVKFGYGECETCVVATKHQFRRIIVQYGTFVRDDGETKSISLISKKQLKPVSTEGFELKHLLKYQEHLLVIWELVA